MANKQAGCAGWIVAGILGLVALSQCIGDDPAPPDEGDSLALAQNTPATDEPERAREFLYVRAETLNCRASPDVNSAPVARIGDRQLVGVVREENGWAKVSEPSCWVRRDFLGASPRERPSARPQTFYGGGESQRASRSAYYANCSAARAAGAAPVYAGDPGYARRLDRDGDGVGCE
ncbi:excalibur calcium-binding domain-containing protein [Brevundimonas sp.]|uniref:excalibur calcium-binding domain-containing protein n=1 Tax=Brevundimonas sp. TaxID=1871086 RepID=UPI0032C23CE2